MGKSVDAARKMADISSDQARTRMAVMMDRMRSVLMALRIDDSGATAIEYALIVGFISITVVSWATFVGTTISGFFTSVAGGL
jgi:pilus assembly protein Flp/PilA